MVPEKSSSGIAGYRYAIDGKMAIMMATPGEREAWEVRIRRVPGGGEGRGRVVGVRVEGGSPRVEKVRACIVEGGSWGLDIVAMETRGSSQQRLWSSPWGGMIWHVLVKSHKIECLVVCNNNAKDITPGNILGNRTAVLVHASTACLFTHPTRPRHCCSKTAHSARHVCVWLVM